MATEKKIKVNMPLWVIRDLYYEKKQWVSAANSGDGEIVEHEKWIVDNFRVFMKKGRRSK